MNNVDSFSIHVLGEQVCPVVVAVGTRLILGARMNRKK